jgi:hypothetical protein
MPRKVVELLVNWKGQLGSLCILEAWIVAPLCLSWYIWREWNPKNFEDCKSSMLENLSKKKKKEFNVRDKCWYVQISLYILGWRRTIVLTFLVLLNFWTCALFLPNWRSLLCTS